MAAAGTAARVQEALRRGAQGRGTQAPLLLAYGQQLLRDGPARFFASMDEPGLADFIAGRYAFAQVRSQQPFSLSIGEGRVGSDRGAAAFSVIEIVVDDRPFLIDSIQTYLVSQDLRIQALLHPILSVKRDAQGALVSVAEHGAAGGSDEAHMFFLVDPVPTRLRQPLLEELRAILYDVIRCVDDYAAVKAQLERLKQEARAVKGGRAVARLLQWCQDGNFVFMGCLPFHVREGVLVARPQDGLGLFHPALHRAPYHEALAAQSTRFLNQAAGAAPFFIVEETTILAKMHHRLRLTVLLISAQPADLRSEALVVAGLFTDRSLRVDALEIPMVEGKIDAVLQGHDIAPGSYKHKELLDVFNGLPRFELFRLSEGMLGRLLGFFLSVVDEPRTEVALLSDEASETLRLLVSLPGREFPQAKMQQVRERIESLLNLTAQNLYVIRLGTLGILVLVFYRVQDGPADLPEAARIDAAVREELLTRDDRLVRQWLAARGSALEERMARTLVEGLPEDYKVSHHDGEVLADLSRLEALVKTDAPQFLLRGEEHGQGVKLALFGWEKLSLSRLMPVLTNLRVLVEEEETFEVQLPERPAYLHTFLLVPPPGHDLTPQRHEVPLRELVFNILQYRSENDPLNALLLSAGFDWRQVGLMQLYRNYLMQVGTVYTKSTINETLIRRSRATRALYGVFRALHDPDLVGREAARREAEAEMEDAEREIDNLTEDRIFKGLLNLVHASIRTSFYRDVDDPVIAVKLASAAIEKLPSPRPLYEIYVYGPLLEGIHLRGDKIARGGIRYSDRPDDFRTEVLGLMATQMKKNALIVPLGSKGGFVVKRLEPYDGNARAAGDAQYRVFIRALLSVTDNLVQGRPLPPPRVVRHDDDDPYLVVAADKGTAHLSDTANEVSQQAGFWLEDAFASGGSNGYDHKTVGITARGAWESVKRLFWEQGLDVQTQPVTVVGIGDMSGDVFGNGLLASRTLKLVGAFDHRHLFLDPDPDPEASYRERERLFRLPRSAWTDYDAKRIGPGGGVYPRSAKAIDLSPGVRAMLGTDAERLSGEELVRALLVAPVDLLWNGGIGTYVKSAAEIQADVGDPNNDAVRVDAKELRARVVGEGGNLGFTQLARVDFDLQGGCIHTDAIDNAGGVNMSDHEVNLKILFSALLDSGQLRDQAARNALLHELEPDVTAAVLRANFRQVLVVGMDRLRSRVDVEPFVRLVDLLAVEGGLDRRTEAIPNTQRLHAFQSDGHGMPRPVLSVLLAYSKMLLYRRLVDSPFVEEPYLEPIYRSYFPRTLDERFDLGAAPHALRRQIVATVVSNRVLDQAGIAFVAELAALSGRSWIDVAQAYLLADAVMNGAAYRECIYAVATTLPADQQYRLLMEFEVLLADAVHWLLLSPDAGEHAFANQERLRGEFRDYCERLPGLLAADDRELVAVGTEELSRMGLQFEAAQLGAVVPHLRGYLLVCALATQGGIALEQAYALTRLANERLRLGQLEAALAAQRYTERMQKRFGDNLLRSLELQRRHKLFAMLEGRSGDDPAAWLESYLQQRAQACAAYEATCRVVFAKDQPDVVSLAVAVGQLEAL